MLILTVAILVQISNHTCAGNADCVDTVPNCAKAVDLNPHYCPIIYWYHINCKKSCGFCDIPSRSNLPDTTMPYETTAKVGTTEAAAMKLEEKDCSGGDWPEIANCCTPTYPCDVGHRDCDNDADWGGTCLWK